MLTATKRALDVVAAVIGLVLAAPIMALVALAVRLTSPGPALYHQQRVGQHGRVFTVHKFRSMRRTPRPPPAPCGPAATTPASRRSARFLRKTRLDELPQLWNVLRGEMSLVGPAAGTARVRATCSPSRSPSTGSATSSSRASPAGRRSRYTYGASVEDAHGEAAVRPVLHQEPVARRSTSSSCSRPCRPSCSSEACSVRALYRMIAPEVA